MSTEQPKRQRRTSAEEGPTIYKCDQLRRMLEEALRNRSKRHAGTDPVKFLGAYLPVRTEANGSVRRKGDEDENPSGVRFHSFCKQLAEALGVSKDFVLERITQGLLHDEAQLKELCDHLTAASEHYSLAMSLIKDESLSRPVTIRIGTTNLINMRVLPAVLEDVRQQFRNEFPNTLLRFSQTILDSDELLFGSQPLVGVDVIVACCLDARAEAIPAAELAATLPLRCCLLRQRPAVTDGLDGQHRLRNWNDLPGKEMVALSTRRKHFDVPWSDIELSMDSIEEVPTLLEAHARVAASDAWTLSYRELMDDVDEQRLEVLDLPPDLQRQSPLIVALMPHSRQKEAKSASLAEADVRAPKHRAMELLKASLQTAFQNKKAMKSEAEEMTRWLARFPYSYHVSDYGPLNGAVQRTWFAGHADLELTSNGNLSGMLTFGSPTGKGVNVRVFGRPIPHHERTVWHLQWRSVDELAESGITNFVVSKSELQNAPALVGTWLGRSSWTNDIHPSGGPFILHSEPGLNPDQLRELVLRRQAQCIPELRQLSEEMIAVPEGEPLAKSSFGGGE